MSQKSRVVLGIRLLIDQAIVVSMLTGCAAQRPASQTGPSAGTTSGIPAPAPAPQTLTDDGIQTIIQAAHLNLLGTRLQMIACASHLGPGLGNTPNNNWPPGRGQQTAGGYTAWRNYVANHIKTNTPFGADYATVAAGALQIGSWTDATGEVCMNLRNIRDVDLLQAIAQADPVQIGQQLYSAFTAYDDATRERAAALLQ
jgi:hypothetical protein